MECSKNSVVSLSCVFIFPKNERYSVTGMRGSISAAVETYHTLFKTLTRVLVDKYDICTGSSIDESCATVLQGKDIGERRGIILAQCRLHIYHTGTYLLVHIS